MKKLSQKSIDFLKILGYMLLQACCVLLLLNLGFGIIEPIPDTLIPLIGNLDEVAEVYLLWWSWPRLKAALKKFKEPDPLDKELHVDNVEYFDVKAEVVDMDGNAKRQTEPEVNIND